jgi:hydroxymethylbilane synthase
LKYYPILGDIRDKKYVIVGGGEVAAILQREDIRDILVSKDNRKIEQMPRGARIGMGSLRRASQLLFVLPDVAIIPLRGNLDTRLKRMFFSQSLLYN